MRSRLRRPERAKAGFLLRPALRYVAACCTTVAACPAMLQPTNIVCTQAEFAKKEGFLLCPEGAATYAAYKKGLADGVISPQEVRMASKCRSGFVMRNRIVS